jgi:hypothetical protein
MTVPGAWLAESRQSRPMPTRGALLNSCQRSGAITGSHSPFAQAIAIAMKFASQILYRVR